MVLVAYRHGLRAIELVALRWDEFRVDIEGFIPRPAVEACVGDYRELPPRDGVVYFLFLDAASGSENGDSYAISVGHKDRVIRSSLMQCAR